MAKDWAQLAILSCKLLCSGYLKTKFAVSVTCLDAEFKRLQLLTCLASCVGLLPICVGSLIAATLMLARLASPGVRLKFMLPSALATKPVVLSWQLTSRSLHEISAAPSNESIQTEPVLFSSTGSDRADKVPICIPPLPALHLDSWWRVSESSECMQYVLKRY